jgi:SNF2 family DNA or RNA helicase
MVIDEAHRLKNSATQVRASLNDLNVDFTVLLTGAYVLYVFSS